MKLFLRGILLLLALNLLDNNILLLKSGFFFSHAYAEEVVLPKVMPGEASYPECGTDVAFALIGLIAGIVAGIMIIVGSGGIIVAVGLGLIAAAVVSAMQLVGCLWSFVRNPVLRTRTGYYKYCQDEGAGAEVCSDEKMVYCEKKESNEINSNAGGCTYAWPRNRAENGKYIEICYREPFDWGYISRAGQETQLDSRESSFTAINLGVLGGENKIQSLDTLIDMKRKVSVRSIQCVTLKNMESRRIGPYVFSAEYDGSKLCGYVTFSRRAKVGCHLRDPADPSPMCIKSKPIYDPDDLSRVLSYDNSGCFSCYISSACYGVTGLIAKAQFPMTSLVVQCIRESLRNILVSDCKESEGFLVIAQKKLKAAVEAVLVLAVLLFGFKLLSGGVSGLQEWTMFVLKIAAIAYFTIGDGMIVYYDRLLTLSTGLADIVYSGGGKKDVCDFDSSEYNELVVTKPLSAEERGCFEAFVKSGHKRDFAELKKFIDSGVLSCSSLKLGQGGNLPIFSKLELKNLSYMTLWDRLDCRVAFYLGSALGNPTVAGGGVATVITAGAISALGAGIYMVPVLILAFFFAGQLVIALLVLMYVILMFLIILWIVHLFILAIIALTILILFSPIFIPMILFQVTKPFFEGWLKEVMAYSLYPIVLFGFLALVFSVFDKLFFDDLTFQRVSKLDGVRSYYSYKLANPNQCKEKNADGELRDSSVLACVIQEMSLTQKPLLFGIYVTTIASDPSSTSVLWIKLGMMALMLFLFFHFLGILGGLAAELVGNFRADLSRHVSSPQSMAKKLAAISLNTSKTLVEGGKNIGKKLGGKRAGPEGSGDQTVKAKTLVEGGKNIGKKLGGKRAGPEGSGDQTVKGAGEGGAGGMGGAG
ncbi:type IV secretion system protein [Neorickettsia sennetsu]|uniref:Type IV secretion system protein VirB6 n=1 Tax=Ehrlichia sennetsu (strain ATCC VR-367 / Miyayama) TaxID=222891 RepID=Q2GCR7_EHRS3|nr:type IV secretion system protein [Neorickettsia sennetsu]ABD45613.1 type IV secretion system protein VirB6 [Neorickettsia sennetsu str. Miyayama]